MNIKRGDRVFYPMLGWGKIELIFGVGIDSRARVKFDRFSKVIKLIDLLNSQNQVTQKMLIKDKINGPKCNECDKLVVIIQEMLLNKVIEMSLDILIDKIKNVCKDNCYSKNYYSQKINKEFVAKVLARNRDFYIIKNDSVILKESLQSSASEELHTVVADASDKQLDKSDDGKEIKNSPTIDDSGGILYYLETKWANEIGDVPAIDASEKNDPQNRKTIYSMVIATTDTSETAMEPRSSFLEGSDGYKEEINNNHLADIKTAPDSREYDSEKQLDKNDYGKELKNFPTIDDSGFILSYWETTWANEIGDARANEVSEKNDPQVVEMIYSTEIVAPHSAETAMEPRCPFLEGPGGYNEKKNTTHLANIKSAIDSGEDGLCILIRKKRKIKIDI